MTWASGALAPLWKEGSVNSNLGRPGTLEDPSTNTFAVTLTGPESSGKPCGLFTSPPPHPSALPGILTQVAPCACSSLMIDRLLPNGSLLASPRLSEVGRTPML